MYIPRTVQEIIEVAFKNIEPKLKDKCIKREKYLKRMKNREKLKKR